MKQIGCNCKPVKIIKIYSVHFKGIGYVSNYLIIAAFSLREAKKIAIDTLEEDKNLSKDQRFIFKTNKIKTNKPSVIIYDNGDY